MIFLTLHPVDRGFAVRKPVCLQGRLQKVSASANSSGKIKIRPSIYVRGVSMALTDLFRPRDIVLPELRLLLLITTVAVSPLLVHVETIRAIILIKKFNNACN